MVGLSPHLTHKPPERGGGTLPGIARRRHPVSPTRCREARRMEFQLTRKAMQHNQRRDLAYQYRLRAGGRPLPLRLK